MQHSWRRIYRSTKRWHRFARARQHGSYCWWPKVIANALDFEALPSCQLSLLPWLVFSFSNVMPKWWTDVCQVGKLISVQGAFCVLEPFIVKPIVATLLRAVDASSWPCSLWYKSVISLCVSSAPRYVNPIQTSTSWYNLYIRNLSSARGWARMFLTQLVESLRLVKFLHVSLL